MKKRTITLSAAALMLGSVGALLGNSHASAISGQTIQSIGALNSGGVHRCIGVEAPYAYSIECNTNDSTQIWFTGAEEGSTGFYQLKNNAGQCLSVYGGGTSQDERIGAGTCNTSHPDQFWTFDDVTTNNYDLVNYHSSYLVTIYGGSTASPTELVQHSDTGSPYQEWSIQAG